MNEILTRREVAALFGVCAPTISRWTTLGVFPAPFRTPGGRLRWHARDIRAILEAQSDGG